MPANKTRFGGKISKAYQAKLDKIKELEQVDLPQLIELFIDMYGDYQKLKSKAQKIQFGEISYSILGLEVRYNLDGSVKESEVQVVDHAVKNSGHSLAKIVKDGTLQRARYLNSIAPTQAKFDSMSEAELKAKTFKGVANYRIEQAIEMIKNHNNSQTEKAKEVCITKGIVFKLTGSNRQTINKFFASHQTMINQHNHQHQLTHNDNRKGKGFDLKALLKV